VHQAATVSFAHEHSARRNQWWRFVPDGSFAKVDFCPKRQPLPKPTCSTP